MTLLAAVAHHAAAGSASTSRSGTPRSTTACVGGGSARRTSRPAKQAAYVARTYVLNAANNVKRVYWYSWDLQNLANTLLTYDNDSR